MRFCRILHLWRSTSEISKGNLLLLILKYISAIIFVSKCTAVMFYFSKHIYKNYLNVLIELWPSPGLVLALSVKPGLND